MILFAKKIEVYETRAPHTEKEKELYEKHYKKPEVVRFIRFAPDFVEFDEWPGNYLSAYYVRNDGTVGSCPADNIKFIYPRWNWSIGK